MRPRGFRPHTPDLREVIGRIPVERVSPPTPRWMRVVAFWTSVVVSAAIGGVIGWWIGRLAG